MVMYKKNASRKTRKNNARKNRKNSMRKNSMRKNSMRKNRMCGMLGGAYNPQELSYAQGKQFDAVTKNYHGGAYTPMGGAPVGDQGLLPQELRDSARIIPLDVKSQEIVGLHDPDQVAMPMSGGRRLGGKGRSSRMYRKSKGSRKNTMRKSSRMYRKNAMRKSRKNNMRKSRKNAMRKSRMYHKNKGSRKSQRGGAYTPVMGSPNDAPNMLLSPSEAAKAGTGDFSNPLLKH
jgi:hypothetical protein